MPPLDDAVVGELLDGRDDRGPVHAERLGQRALAGQPRTDRPGTGGDALTHEVHDLTGDRAVGGPVRLPIDMQRCDARHNALLPKRMPWASHVARRTAEPTGQPIQPANPTGHPCRPANPVGQSICLASRLPPTSQPCCTRDPAGPPGPHGPASEAGRSAQWSSQTKKTAANAALSRPIGTMVEHLIRRPMCPADRTCGIRQTPAHPVRPLHDSIH